MLSWQQVVITYFVWPKNSRNLPKEILLKYSIYLQKIWVKKKNDCWHNYWGRKLCKLFFFCMQVSSFLHWLITASYFMLYFPGFGRKKYTGHCELRTAFKIFMQPSFLHTKAMRKWNTLFNYRKDYQNFKLLMHIQKYLKSGRK